MKVGIKFKSDLYSEFNEFYTTYLYHLNLCFPMKKNYNSQYENSENKVNSEIEQSSHNLKELFRIKNISPQMLHIYRNANTLYLLNRIKSVRKVKKKNYFFFS